MNWTVGTMHECHPYSNARPDREEEEHSRAQVLRPMSSKAVCSRRWVRPRLGTSKPGSHNEENEGLEGDRLVTILTTKDPR